MTSKNSPYCFVVKLRFTALNFVTSRMGHIMVPVASRKMASEHVRKEDLPQGERTVELELRRSDVALGDRGLIVKPS